MSYDLAVSEDLYADECGNPFHPSDHFYAAADSPGKLYGSPMEPEEILHLNSNLFHV